MRPSHWLAATVSTRKVLVPFELVTPKNMVDYAKPELILPGRRMVSFAPVQSQMEKTWMVSS